MSTPVAPRLRRPIPAGDDGARPATRGDRDARGASDELPARIHDPRRLLTLVVCARGTRPHPLPGRGLA